MANNFFGGMGPAQTIATAALAYSAGNAIGNAVGSMITGSSAGTDPNMLISRFRSQGIPTGAESSYNYSPQQAQFSSSPEQKDWRLKISSNIVYQNDILQPLAFTGGVIFPYLPTVTISHSADYQKIDTAHTNYPFYAYKNSQVEDIQINGKFTVSDEQEGQYWVAAVHFFRTVTKMYFGTGANLGNPPPICTLNGYGDFVFNNVSCVIKSFQVELTPDVDYISVRTAGNTGNKNSGSSITYVPTLSNFSVTLAPVYSRDKIKTFNLANFAKGQLVTNVDGKGFI